MMTRKRSKLQTAMERRAYEVLLRDAMRDESRRKIGGIAPSAIRSR